MTAYRPVARRVPAVTAALICVAASLAAAPPAALAAPENPDPRPVDAVVLVDESGSLQADGVAAERAAAKIITQSEFSPDSRLAVVGFASDNGQGHGPVDVVCPMGKADAGAARERYLTCVDDLAIRPSGEDDDTDFPSAIRQGLKLLGESGKNPKILFLLTDGVLDVSDSPSYGQDRDLRNAVAEDQLTDLLAEARERQVQIWPLGFGPSVRKPALDAFAAGGGRQPCSSSAAAPTATVVSGPADVVAALQAAFAAARCAALTPPQKTKLPSGGSKELAVDIPRIATYGSMTVLKGDPTVEVAYRDPAGKIVPKTGTSALSTFEVSGERSSVEVLRIKNPVAGTWHLELTSSPDTPEQQVSARVLWQGVVQAAVVVDPPQPAAGQPVAVSVGIFTPSGTVDTASLDGLAVSVKATGDGFSPIAIPVRDDGKDGDRAGGDGQFTGRVTVPATASGALSFTGEVAGEGIVTDERAVRTNVQTQESAVYASIDLSSGVRVSPGGSVDGTVRFSNNSGTAKQVRLVPADLDDGTLVTVQPSTLTVDAASGTSAQRFTLSFAAATKHGPAQVTVRAVDAADGTVYGNAAARYDIAPAPRTLFWTMVGAGAAVLVVVLVWLVIAVRRREAERNVRPLAAVLYRDDHQAQVLNAPDRRARTFRFAVRDEINGLVRLDLAAPGEPAYSVARRPGGIALLRTPFGDAEELAGSRRHPLPDGVHEIGIDDPTRSAPRPRAASRKTSTPAAESGPDGTGTASGPGFQAGTGAGDDDSLVW